MGLCGSKKQIIVPTKIIVKTDDFNNNNNNNYNKNKENVSKYSIQNNYNNEVNIHINNNNNRDNQNNILNFNSSHKNGSNANIKESNSGILKLISVNNSENCIISDNENNNKQNNDNDILIIYPEKKISNSIIQDNNKRKIFHHKTSKNVNFKTRPSLRTLTPNQFEHNNFECTDTNLDNDEPNNYVNRAAFKRRNKRGKTLVDKSKLGSKIFKEV